MTYHLHRGEAAYYLSLQSDQTADLVVTSPPYNLGKIYEKEARLEDYLADQEPIIADLYRVLSDRGSVCWQVGNYVNRGEVFPLDMYYYPIFKRQGFKLRNRIVWHFGHGLHTSKRFSGRYETLLWFTKSDDYTFNLDPVRVPSKYPGKRHFKGPNKGQLSGNPAGKNPSDVWEIIVHDWEIGLWDIPNVKHNHPEKTAHPCQFPIELVERCVLALTEPGDWVLDPYMGVGSTILASLMHDRHAIGIERDHQYAGWAQDRIQAFEAGTLKTRPIEREVYRPKGSAAQIPPEWQS